MANRRARALGLIAGLLAALIFGGGAVVSRHLVTAQLHAADLTVLRYVGCFPLALAASLAWSQRVRLKLPWRQFAILLVLGGPPYHLLLIAGYLHATAGGGALLVTGLLPVFSIAIAMLTTARVPAPPVLAGGALTLAGIAVFTGSASGAAVAPLGLAIFCGAALAWALLNHCVGVWRVDPLRLTVALALWSPLFLPVYLLLRPPRGLPPVSSDLLLQIVYHGWLVAVVATILCFATVRLAGAQWAAALLALTPLCAAALGAVLLGEPLTLDQLAGAGLTIGGIALMARRNTSDDLNGEAARGPGAKRVACPAVGDGRGLRPEVVTSPDRGT